MQQDQPAIRLIRHSRDRYQIITPHTVDLGSAEKLENFLTQEINAHRTRTIELAAAKQRLRAMVAAEQGERLPEPVRVETPTPVMPPPSTFNARASRRGAHRVDIVATSPRAAADAVSAPKTSRRRSGASYLAHLRQLQQQEHSAQE